MGAVKLILGKLLLGVAVSEIYRSRESELSVEEVFYPLPAERNPSKAEKGLWACSF